MRLLPIARLLRLPNVFTSFADIGLGVCIASAWAAPVNQWAALWLFLASGALYVAGMVWNDWFDLAEDLRERPHRPLASGQLSTRFAVILGTILLGLGVGFAFLAPHPAGWIGLGLAVNVLLYDGWLKRTAFGPIAMGSCRFLNVLLGLTLIPVEAMDDRLRIHLAAVIGVYIIGVTWFARTEATMSQRTALISATGVMAIAGLLALAIPLQLPTGSTSIVFPFIMAVLVFRVGQPLVRAIRMPTPAHVQRAVKQCIFGLVLLDATLATIFIGLWGLLLLLLLPPAIWLGKWVYST